MRVYALVAAAVALARSVGATVVTHSSVVAVEVPSAVRQVSFDGRTVCAVTAKQGVFCGSAGSSGAVSSWTQTFQSNATWVTVAAEDMWLLDASHQLQYYATNAKATWRPNKNAAFGSVVASDGACTCNLYLSAKPICAAASGRGNLQWFTNGIERETRAIDVGQRLVVGVDSNGSTYAYRCGEYLDEQPWMPASPGPYRSIATDGDFTCATKDTTETVFCHHNSTGDWQPIAAKFTQIALRDGRLYGVAGNGTLWTTTLKLGSDSSANLEALKMAERDAEGKFS
ncbi:hypothetical protein PINS_up006872 [Pythium insidiosum]|nr:hypothetical protein PINS_up006872 [Pythium insidiosum]